MSSIITTQRKTCGNSVAFYCTHIQQYTTRPLASMRPPSAAHCITLSAFSKRGIVRHRAVFGSHAPSGIPGGHALASLPPLTQIRGGVGGKASRHCPAPVGGPR